MRKEEEVGTGGGVEMLGAAGRKQHVSFPGFPPPPLQEAPWHLAASKQKIDNSRPYMPVYVLNMHIKHFLDKNLSLES